MKAKKMILLLALVPSLALAQVSNRLEAGYDGTVSPGGPLSLYCRSPSAEWTSCRWTDPAGAEYEVLTGREDFVDGALADELTCAIATDALTTGAWVCDLTLDGVSEFQRAAVNAIEESRVEDVRIDLAFLPEEYSVDLAPDFDTLLTKGFVSATMEAQPDGEGTSTVHLHIKDMTVWEDTVVVTRTGPGLFATEETLTIAGFFYDEDRQFFDIIVEETFSEGDTVVASMEFQGNLRDDLAGLYRSSYVEDGVTKYLAVTQFQSTDARKAFPCMDEPALKANFTVRLGRKDDPLWSTASNMPHIAENTGPVEGMPGYVWDDFQTTNKMASYLVAFLISEFERNIGTPFGAGDEGEFGVWSRPDLIDQFQIEFPLPKQDMVAVPDLSFGGMENWGLVTYRESALPYEEGVSSIQYKDYIDGIVAHELAHQWFGDLVTMGWWSDLWLNEGFAEFMSYKGSEWVSPDFARLERFILNNNLEAYGLDAYESSHPINMDVGHPDEINELFDTISYEKGCSLIRMMNVFLTEEVFNTGINDYLNTYAYGNAFQDDLWEKLSDAATAAGVLGEGLDVKTIMDTWSKQKGFPTVTVTRSGNTVTASQARFLLGPTDLTDTNDYTWWVPLSYAPAGGDFASAAAQSPKGWIEAGTDSVELELVGVGEDTPAIFNVQGSCYYRVNYDRATWFSIASSLQSDPDSVHPSSRAQLVDDALSMGREGSLAYDAAMEQTLYLDAEEDYVPWSAAVTATSYVSLMLRGSDAGAPMAEYIQAQAEHLYERLGYDPIEGEAFQDVLLRSLTLGLLCGYDYPACRDRAVEDFLTWRESPFPDLPRANPIDAEVKDSAYCTAIRNGDSEDWDFLFARFQATDNSDERGTILAALSCSTNPVILNEYISKILPQQDGIRTTDALTIVSAMAGSSVGEAVAWNWLQNEWEDIHEILDTAVSSPVARIVDAVTAGFNTDEELQELQDFYDDNFAILGTAERATETALETVEANVAWMADHYDEVETWLDENTGDNDRPVFPLRPDDDTTTTTTATTSTTSSTTATTSTTSSTTTTTTTTTSSSPTSTTEEGDDSDDEDGAALNSPSLLFGLALVAVTSMLV